MMKRSDDYQGLINALERRVRELEARLAAAEARIAALEQRGYPVQPLPVITPMPPCTPPPGWPWYPTTCQSDGPMTISIPPNFYGSSNPDAPGDAPAVTIKPLGCAT